MRKLLVICLRFYRVLCESHHEIHPVDPLDANSIINPASRDTFAIFDEFPTFIHQYHMRRDENTQNLIESGLLQYFGGPYGGESTGITKVTYQEFKRLLQCPLNEPNIDGNRGITNLLKIIKPNRNIVELMCIWCETRCRRWKECQERLVSYRKDAINIPDSLNSQSDSTELIRFMNGSFYYDWPFRRSRFDKKKDQIIGKLKYFFLITDKISDLEDMVFLFGDETPFLPYNFPFPALSFSPGVDNVDIPVPWPRSIVSEMDRYIGYQLGQNTTYSRYQSSSYNEWIQRLNKAGFYGGEITDARRIIYDLATLRPDLIDAKFLNDISRHHIKAWNPESDEEFSDLKSAQVADKYAENPINTTGYIQSLLRHHILEGVDYLTMKYKYLIVINGKNNEASADRLAELIAHSGAVVLLQTSSFEYHFSYRLKPWVHYVPISYNTADVVAKIEWLQNNPHLAYRIASNARIFGKSYLRLEDYFCYMATLLKTLGELVRGSDALEPFDPVRLELANQL